MWYCCHCCEHFDSSSLLVSHSAVHNTSDKEICNVCNIAYIVHLRNISQPNETNIKVEIVEIGEDDNAFEYDDVEDFLHLPLALDIEDKIEAHVDVFICNYCSVFFMTKGFLEVHMKSTHSDLYDNLASYECGICPNPRSYTRQQDIRKHMRTIHNDETTDVLRFLRKSTHSKVNLKNTISSYYECKSCNKTYSRSQDIIKHMRFVHNKIGVDPVHYKRKVPLSLINFPEYKIITNVVYKCEVCEELFAEVNMLVKHMNDVHDMSIGSKQFIAHSSEVYGCKSCDQGSFLSLNDLRAHYFQKHGYEPHIYVCPKCNEYFLFGSNMGKHLREVHADTVWSNRDLLSSVVRIGKEKMTASNDNDHSCTYCSTVFQGQQELDAHLEVAHADQMDGSTLNKIPEIKNQSKRSKNRLKVICSQCDQTFACKKGLIDHLSNHSTDSTLLCQKCNESFENLNYLWSHIFSKHPLEPHQCSVCSVPFDRKANLIKHMLENHGIVLILEDPEEVKKIKDYCRTYIDGILKYKCQECSIILGSFRSLRTHTYIHKGVKPIICDQCSKQFRTTSALRTHMTIVHDNIRRYRCEYCGRAFSCQSNLIQHIRIHTGEKPYVCDECGNRYAQSASLYSHKLTHAQNYCHVCPECGRSFHRITRLRQHMRIHSGDRPPRSHICDICHKGFRTNSERKRHQQIHNSIRSFVCETCGSGFTVKKYLIQHYKIHRELNEVTVETVTDIGFVDKYE